MRAFTSRTRQAGWLKPITLAALLCAQLVACQQTQTPPAENPEVAASATSPQQASTAQVVDEYQTLPPDQREKPPESGPTPAWSFPKIAETKLANGLQVKTLTRDGLPLVEVTLVVLSGQASDGKKPGLALLAGEMLKVGGSGPYSSKQLLNRVESLGSSLNVVTSRDSTTITLNVTSDRVDEAMELLGLVVRKPKFNAKEFTKLQKREIDRVSGLSKSSAGWVSSMVMYRELYRTEGGDHPYASYDATEKQLEDIGLWEVQNWYRSHFVPGNAFVVFAGNITPDTAQKLTQKSLGQWRGKAPASVEFTAPTPPSALKLFLVDRPDSPQAELALAMLGPKRKAPDWAQLKVANQILGGGVSGRLFLDVREKQSLAYSTYSYVGEVAHGPAPLVLKAGTQTAKAGLTAKALLENAKLIASVPPSEKETHIATRYLADVFLLRMETVSDMASMVASLGIFDLPNTYYDEYRTQLLATTPQTAHAAAAEFFKPDNALLIVAGDAERLKAPLSHFGEVHVLDPAKDFAEAEVVPHNPAAKVELQRIDGT